MKRWILCLSCVLLAIFAVMVQAEETILSNATKVYTGQTTVLFVVGEYYEVVIPPGLPVSYGAETTDLTLSITDLELTPGYRLSIGVQSPEGSLENTDGEGSIPYSLEDDEGLFDERFYDAMGDVTLRLRVNKQDWHAAPAGAYEGRLTFRVIPKYVQEGDN